MMNAHIGLANITNAHRGLANITNANRGLAMLTNVGDSDSEWYQCNTDEYEMMSVGHQQHQ